jgi:hypothetical protein
MVQSDIVLAGALRRHVVLELQQREVHHAVGQEHAFRELAVGLAELFQAERLLVELRRSPGIGTLIAMCRIFPLLLAAKDGSSLR